MPHGSLGASTHARSVATTRRPKNTRPATAAVFAWNRRQPFTTGLPACSRASGPRIQHTIREVRDDVHADDGEGREEQDAEENRIVPLEHRLEQEPARPGPRKDRLDQYRPA